MRLTAVLVTSTIVLEFDLVASYGLYYKMSEVSVHNGATETTGRNGFQYCMLV